MRFSSDTTYSFWVCFLTPFSPLSLSLSLSLSVLQDKTFSVSDVMIHTVAQLYRSLSFFVCLPASTYCSFMDSFSNIHNVLLFSPRPINVVQASAHEIRIISYACAQILPSSLDLGAHRPQEPKQNRKRVSARTKRKQERIVNICIHLN